MRIRNDRPFFTAPHIIILVFISAAVLVGVQINADQNGENCKAILTLSRNLFHQLPAPQADMEPPGFAAAPDQLRAYVRERIRIYVQEELGKFYGEQYDQINRAFHLEDRCGGDLPKGTPPPPSKP